MSQAAAVQGLRSFEARGLLRQAQSALRDGQFADAMESAQRAALLHEMTGDNAGVLPTDTMKNTVYAFAKKHGVGEPEEFGLLLARHFVATQPQVTTARVSIESFGWQRLGPHSFARKGDHTRLASVLVTDEFEQVVSGVTGLVLLNSTASEFRGFPRDEYTTLPETTDRILATAVDARWRHLSER
jgi:urate oxidase